MKKYNLLKILGITLLVVTLISWIVPAGLYSNGTFKSLDATVPIGLYDLFRLPVISIVTFIQYGLLFLTIGGFYGVLNKTGVYSNIVENVSSIKNKSMFLSITIVMFALLVSVIGLPNLMFVLVPFFVAVLLKMGYSKMTAFSATIGSILFGQIGTTFGFSIWGFLKYVFGVEMTDLLLARVILLIIVVALFILFVRKMSFNDIDLKSKKNKEKEEISIPLLEETSSGKSIIPLVIISILLFILLVIGLYNWYYAFEIELFTNIYETIRNFEVNGYPLFSNLLGSVTEFGFFGNYDLIVILIFTSLIIGWIYGVKFNDIIEGFGNGCKSMIKPALYSMLSCVIFTAFLNMTNNYGGDFVYTIINKFVKDGSQFSLASTIGSGLVVGFAYNDFYTLSSSLSGIFSVYDSNIIPIISFVFQTMYSIVMVIAPTSIYLLAGLSYLEIPYTKWVGYIWKLLLAIFGIIVVITFLLTTLL